MEPTNTTETVATTETPAPEVVAATPKKARKPRIKGYHAYNLEKGTLAMDNHRVTVAARNAKKISDRLAEIKEIEEDEAADLAEYLAEKGEINAKNAYNKTSETAPVVETPANVTVGV